MLITFFLPIFFFIFQLFEGLQNLLSELRCGDKGTGGEVVAGGDQGVVEEDQDPGPLLHHASTILHSNLVQCLF